ncbi:MAG TPA: glycoside hydrolase family 2 TIM barrel-domain containing protein [Bacteroidota bacterium]|nr:glycoside hydrolase family 2 TIM barrel-domain containing protein [Bacteroidota bacterium]
MTSTRARKPLRYWTFLPGILLYLLILPHAGYSQNATSTLRIFQHGSGTPTGKDVGMFPESPARKKLDLAGTWQYSFDGKVWKDVQVPGAFDYTGSLILRREFEVSPDLLDRRLFSLVLYGVNYQSEIRINGIFVGRHTGGYTSLVIPVPGNVLQAGPKNVITVSVDNTLSPRTTVPLRQQVGGWKTYAGIFRDIYLLVTRDIAIGEISVVPEYAAGNKSAKLTVAADVISGPDAVIADSGGAPVFIAEVMDRLTGEPVASSPFVKIAPEPNKTIRVTSTVTVPAPKLWSPELPDLYTVRCRILRRSGEAERPVDEHSADAGLRVIEWKSGLLQINGKPTPLKGILWQEEHDLYGSALPYEILEKDISAIKTLGANLIRFLYPPHPYVLSLCDRYGLLVMEEVPLNGVPTEILSQDFYQELTTSYLREMVSRDRGHPSVIAWGLGSDFETSAPLTCDVITSMRSVVRAIDTRPVYYSSRTPHDPCSEFTDLSAISLLDESPAAVRDSIRGWRSLAREKPVILVRYGREVEPGNRNGYSDPLSLEAQARFAMQIYETIRDAPVAGSVLWSYNDWHTDRPALSSHSRDPRLQAMGIVDGTRERRIAFDVVRSLFNGEKVYALPVGNYSSSAPVVFVVSGLVILIAFAFLYNGNRRFRDAVNRSLARTYNFFADVRDQRIITYGHSLFLAVIVSITWATLLGSVLTFYRDSLLLDNLLSFVMSDGVKEQFVRLVWNPPAFIMAASAVIFLKLIALSLVVRILSMLVRTPVNFYHAFSITMWAMLPYVIFIPVAMVLYRLMETDYYTMPVLVLMAGVSVWVLMRFFKGVAIIFDVFPAKVYAVGLLLIVVTGAALFGYLDYAHSTSLYLRHVMHLVNRTT